MHMRNIDVENLKLILPELFNPQIKAEFVAEDNSKTISLINDEIKKLHKQKLCEILSVHYILEEFGKLLQPYQSRVIATLLHSLLN